MSIAFPILAPTPLRHRIARWRGLCTLARHQSPHPTLQLRLRLRHRLRPGLSLEYHNPLTRQLHSSPIPQSEPNGSVLAEVEDLELELNTGRVPLRIYRPKSTPTAPSPRSAIVLLPPLPDSLTTAAGSDDSKPTALPDDHIGSILSSVSNLAVVRVGYRGGPAQPFPVPLFDCAAAVDWVGSHIEYVNSQADDEIRLHPSTALRWAKATAPTAMVQKQTRLAVYGTAFGGSLALSLGLTECRVRRQFADAAWPAIVTTVGVQDPVVDWVDPDPEAYLDSAGSTTVEAHDQQQLVETKQTPLPIEKLRRILFNRQVTTFDPFASPLLFFRNAKVEEETSLKESDDTALEPDPLSYEDRDGKSKRSRQKTGPVSVRSYRKTRRTHKVFPPTRSDLKIPDMCVRVSVVRGGEVKDQVDEFVGLVRRSIHRDEAGQAEEEEEDGDEDGPKKRKAATGASDVVVELARQRVMYIVPPDDTVGTGKKRGRKAGKTRKTKSSAMTDTTAEPVFSVDPADPIDARVDPELAHLVGLGRWFGRQLRD